MNTIKNTLNILYRLRYALLIALAVMLIILLSALFGRSILFKQDSHPQSNVVAANDISTNASHPATIEDAKDIRQTSIESSDDSMSEQGQPGGNVRPDSVGRACDPAVRADASKSRANAISEENERHKKLVKRIREDSSNLRVSGDSAISSLLQPEYNRHTQAIQDIKTTYQKILLAAGC